MDITLPLAWVLDLCHRLTGSYAGAILLFTALTKVLLLPLSLWVQGNNLRLLALRPELNALKLQFFGDRDTLAEETLALYKRRGYRSFLAVVPTVLQLLLLIGVIGAVRTVLGDARTVLTAVPARQGGLTWLLPPAAALAALVLGLAQNRLSPLQREQTAGEQWLANGLSIAVSLVLGAFVSLGVGLYWVAGNLLTVPQQALVNALLPPKKYVDYGALEKSKAALAEAQGLSGRRSRALRRRERADYKRFFSVAGKHLVFYSEGSGFYKYYRGIIEYLLARSNVTVHYVTSDPDDRVFALEEPRLRAYYIGRTRLITLFMKMDADMVVMTCPDLGNYHLKRSYVRRDIEYVYLFHYPLSTHMVLNPCALDHYDTVFCVGSFQIPEIRAAEKLRSLPPKNLVEVGYGQLDLLLESYAALDPAPKDRPLVVVAPSWQADNILDSCIDPLLRSLLDRGWQVVVRPHPEYKKRFGPRLNALVDRWQGREDLVFELDFSGNRSIFAADVLITDWSGTAYEFAFVTGRTPVFVDTAPKIHNPDYGALGLEPLEFSLRDRVGIRVDPKHLEDLGDRVARLLSDPQARDNRALGRELISNLGRSGPAGAKYILRALVARQKGRKS